MNELRKITDLAVPAKQKITDIYSRFKNQKGFKQKLLLGYQMIKNEAIEIYKQMTSEEFKATLNEKLDRWSKFIFTRAGSSGNGVVDYAKGPFVFGTWVIIICFGVFGLWAAIAPINSAAIAPGVVVLYSSKKTIQHLEGGIISEILVKEGQHVEEGQPLIKLDETNSMARYNLILGQMKVLSANQSRLIAERDGFSEVSFDSELFPDPDNDDISRVQKNLFITRTKALDGQISLLEQKIAQSRDQIDGMTSQKEAREQQLALINEEIAVVKKLLESGNAQRPRLLSLQRNASALSGEVGALNSQMAQAEQEIASANLQIINAKNERMDNVIKEMRETQAQLADASEKMKSAKDMLDRSTVTAPIAGMINGLRYHTIGGVITPGNPILDIVPSNEKLIVEAQVQPTDIDIVHPGMEAKVTLSAYRTRYVPSIMGKVETVSGDRMVEQNTGRSFFIARIVIDEKTLAHLKEKHVELYPGMPADTMIITGSRTMLAYMLDPITAAMDHSFRE